MEHLATACVYRSWQPSTDPSSVTCGPHVVCSQILTTYFLTPTRDPLGLALGLGLGLDNKSSRSFIF